MTKQIKKLINKYGAEQLKSMIDDIVEADDDYNRLKSLLVEDELAINYFRTWAKTHGFTIKETYNGRRLDIVELPLTGPYVVLWLAHNGETAHFELGESLEKLWWADGYKDLESKLERLLQIKYQLEEA